MPCADEAGAMVLDCIESFDPREIEFVDETYFSPVVYREIPGI
jgi:hypothetical protein